MDSTEGNLVELGNNLKTNLGTTYSFITIGDTMLQQVVVPRGLDNFVLRSLNMGGTTKLYTVPIGKNIYLVGLQQPDGKIFYHRQSAGPGYIMVIAGIPFIAILIGFAFINQGLAILKVANAGKQLESMGGTGMA